MPTGSTNDFELGPILAPLEPFKDQLIIVDGMEQLRPGPGDGHQKGMATLWSGSELLEGGDFQGGGDSGTVGWGGGITIDQEVANAIGTDTAYKSLEFGVQTGGATVWSRQSYAGSNQPIAPEDSPTEMFDRLFGDLDIDTEALEKLKAERRSVIDRVKGDLELLEGKYGTDDKLKIEAHLDANPGDRAAQRSGGPQLRGAGAEHRDRPPGQRPVPERVAAADRHAGDGAGVRPDSGGEHPVVACGQ